MRFIRTPRLTNAEDLPAAVYEKSIAHLALALIGMKNLTIGNHKR